MKKYTLLALSMALTFCLYANINPKAPKSQCRMDSAELNLCENISLRLKTDLLTGTWSERIDNQTDTQVEKIFQFQSIGLVDITINYADGRTEQERRIWRVQDINNQAFLILTNIGSDESSTYLMEQTCHGMILKDQLLEKQKDWTVRE